MNARDKKRKPPKRAVQIQGITLPLVKTLLLATIAIGVAAWALARHYRTPRLPMVVPAPTEIPAPEIEREP